MQLQGVALCAQSRRTPKSLVIKILKQEQVPSKPGTLPNGVLSSRILNRGCQIHPEQLECVSLVSSFLQERPRKCVLLSVCVCVTAYSNTVPLDKCPKPEFPE